jgi:hypothetical protein
MFKFEDYQVYGKNGYEAMVASATAWSKGYQAMTQEMVDFSKKEFGSCWQGFGRRFVRQGP